jgi:hypothetical protein
MGRQRLETTDRRYVKVGEDEWWDTTGIEIVPGCVVDDYMAASRVGIAVIEVPDEEAPPSVH